MDKLLDVMRKLRVDCPWDKEQTHISLKKHLIEETYEVIDAIDSGDDNLLREELGDLLLQVAFHCVIAEEQDRFDYLDVETAICNKLISRHSHIFGEDTANSAQEVVQTWEKNKRKEKGNLSYTSMMENVPLSFPALLRSLKVQDKASKLGFDWDKASDALFKVEEEIQEFNDEIKRENKKGIEQEGGDLLFSVVNVFRLLKIDPELALNGTVRKFIKRFSYMENKCLKEGRDMQKMSLEELDNLWEQAKTQKGSG